MSPPPDPPVSDDLPRLASLLALSAKPGVDVRPTLLRMLTDLFLEAGQRSQAETARFAELAAHLVDAVDEATRIQIADKLAPCASAPRAVLDRLLAAEPAVAARVALSPVLTENDLWSLAAEGEPVLMAALAARPDLPAELVGVLARRGEPLVAQSLAGNPRAPLDRPAVAALAPLQAELPELAASLAQHPAVQTAWLAPFLLSLDADLRRTVIAAVQAERHPEPLPAQDLQPSVPAAGSALARFDALERDALLGRRTALALKLAEALSIPGALADRIIADPQGTAFALALVSIGVPVEQASKILLALTPAAQASLAGLRDLVSLMEGTPRAVAGLMVRLATAAPARGPGRHRPVFAEGNPVRTAPATRRPAAAAERVSRDGSSS